MKKSLFVFVVIAILSALVLAACGGGGDNPGEKPVPDEFANKANPLSGNADAATAGQALYSTNCASCHGDGGKGDGPAAASLDPKPANLVEAAAEFTDGGLYWIVSEGGAAKGLSASMAGYKSLLSEEEIWQVVTYLKTLK